MRPPRITQFIFTASLHPSGKYVGLFAIPGDDALRPIREKHSTEPTLFEDEVSALINAARVMRKYVNNAGLNALYMERHLAMRAQNKNSQLKHD